MSDTTIEQLLQSAAAARATAPSTVTIRARLATLSLAIAGVFFVLYPAIRPFSSEKGLDGAAAFGSSHWILAHMLAMVGFTLLALGVVGLYSLLQRFPIERRAFWALVVTVAGVGLSLPFYGGEAYGLHAIGQRALTTGNGGLVDMASVVRGGAGLFLFLTGLLVLAIGTILVAIAIWKSGVMAKWSGVPLAVAFSLYIPQFFGTQPIRVAHGLLVLLGCLWIGIEMWRVSSRLGEAPDRAVGNR